MKQLYLLFIVIIISNLGLSQNPIWPLPSDNSSSGYSANLGPQLPLPTIDPITEDPYDDLIGPNSGYIPEELGHKGAANAISGPDGNLLFFIVGNSIFDRDGRAIFSDHYNFLGLNLGSGYSEILVVPNPANCNQYYIFTERIIGPPNATNIEGFASITACYALLDVSQTNAATTDFNPNAKGTLIIPFTDIVSLTPYQSAPASVNATDISMAATIVTSNNSRFVFIIQYVDSGGSPPTSQTQLFMAFRLNSNGIELVYSQPTTAMFSADYNVTGRMELEVVQAGINFKLATATIDEIITFNLNYDPILDDVIYPIPSLKKADIGSIESPCHVRGIEFARNGLYVYFTHEPSDLKPNAIDCFNTVTGSFEPLSWASTFTNDPTMNEFEFTYIETGTDGNLYLASNTSMGQITGSFIPSTSNFNPNFQPINYAANYWNYVDPYDIYKRYTLPDQIDDYNYNSHFSVDPLCCIYAKPYDADFYTADANNGLIQTWNEASNPLNNGFDVAHIYGDLIIPAGMDVTISGMTLYFHPEARIIVERSDDPNLPNGAKLTLNNCLLTADKRCGDVFMWQGIVVEGHYGQSQMPINDSKQGFLQMNNSTISNSMVGAQAYSPIPNPITGGLDPTNRGGIIKTLNSTFINNRIDVRIYNYINTDINGNVIDNQCLFANTTFKTDGLLNEPSLLPLAHAYLYQSGGIRFVGCDFINVDETAYAETQRGMGIFNVRNKLTVIPGCSLPSVPCTANDPNTFTNLTFGIYSVAGLSLIGLEITGNNFVNNFTGVYVGGLIGSKILDNNFEILRSSNPDIGFNKTSGIYLNGCTKYKIEENTFQDFNDPLISSAYTRGIVVNNSGEEHNEIYKNTFEDLLVGGQSQNINAVEVATFPVKPKIVGLQWLCNNFQSNIDVDLYVSSGRIDYYQGYTLPPSNANAPYAGARNIFDIQPGDYEIVTTPSVNNIFYSHYANPNTILWVIL